MCTPRPVQQPHPPILLGGSGKGLLRVAARHADIVNLTADVGRAGTVDFGEVARFNEAAFVAKGDFVRAEARAAGRDPAAIAMSSIVFMLMITDTSAAGEAMARASRRCSASIPPGPGVCRSRSSARPTRSSRS